jgi:hypothetical protein
MKIRSFIIVILVSINLLLGGTLLFTLKKPEYKILDDNVTIHETIEQTASMEHPDFIKEDYVLALPEGENIALKKKVKASSFNDVYTPRKVVDGIATGPSYWEGKPDSYPNTITVDLEEESTIHAIRVCLSPMAIWGKRVQTFSVLISKEGETFTELYGMKDYNFEPDTGNEVQFLFDDIRTRYVMLEFTNNTGSGGAQVAEFEIYSK